MMSEATPGDIFRFATEAFPADTPDHRRVDSFLECFAHFCPLEREPWPDSNNPFWARIEGHQAGPVFNATFAASAGVVRRTPRTIAERPTDSVYVFQQIDPEGSSFTTWKGRRGGHLHAGDLYIASTEEPFESLSDEGFHHRIWLIPSRLVLPFAQNPSELEAGVWLRADDPCNMMIATYLTEFARQGPRMSPQVADVFAGNIGRLLSVASVASDNLLRRTESACFARRERIKQEIEARLADPLLSPARLADALGLSLRTLHLAFAPTEETCAAYISRRRLDEARTLVVGAPWRAISDIAFGLGFNSMGTFFRTYRNRFGETPTETRRKHFAQRA